MILYKKKLFSKEQPSAVNYDSFLIIVVEVIFTCDH